MAGSSTIEELPPQHQVLVSLSWAKEIVSVFVSHLDRALKSNNIKVSIGRRQQLEVILGRIEDSRIALVIFSEKYTESIWGLRELEKIADCVEKGKLVAIPIFYMLDPSTVKGLKGRFGDAFRDLRESDATKERWEKALKSIADKTGFVVGKRRNESKILETIMVEVKRVMNQISSEGNQEALFEIKFHRRVRGFSAMAGSSTIEVFVNLCWGEIRYGFFSHLDRALKSNNIKVFIDTPEDSRQQLEREVILGKIEESRIALVIFSEEYTKSMWCLRELEKIADCVEKGKLVAIPIFYKLDPSTVKGLEGQFGDAFRHLPASDATKERWKKALKSIAYREGILVGKKSNESIIVESIVVEVKRVMNQISSEGNQETSVDQISLEGNQEASVDPSENIDAGTFGIKQSLKELGDKLDLNNNITSQLLLLFFCLPHIAYMSTPLLGKGGAIDRIVENVPKVLEYVPEDKFTEFPTGKFGAKPESSSPYAKTNADFLGRTFTNSPMSGKVKPPNIQVFINFRGDQLRNNFVGYLVDALRRSEINVFIDTKANIGDDLINLFKRIEDSGIAIVVFSSRYTESEWCLNELVKIKERAHQGLLKVLPIFYKVTPGNVKRLKGDFGDNFRDKEYMYASDEPKIKQWKEAILFVSHKFALTFDEKSSVLEIDFIETIVKEVLKMLQAISTVESGQSYR